MKARRASMGNPPNREATTLKEIPASIVILGGGSVGVELGLLADREREVLIGGVGRRPARGRADPLRRARHQDAEPLPVLRDTVAQFPTFNEANLKAIEKLEPV